MDLATAGRPTGGRRGSPGGARPRCGDCTGACAAGRVAERSGTVAREFADEKGHRDRLRRYFSPQVADRILDASAGTTEGEAREITVLFSDIRGFTTLSE